MILTGEEIKAQLGKNIVIEPFDVAMLNPNTMMAMTSPKNQSAVQNPAFFILSPYYGRDRRPDKSGL